jgi:hypothetical protein
VYAQSGPARVLLDRSDQCLWAAAVHDAVPRRSTQNVGKIDHPHLVLRMKMDTAGFVSV